MASEDEEERSDTSIEANSETAMEEEEYYTSDDSETSIFKRRKSNDEEKALESVVDRISALPDSLLLHILSSLPTKSVFKTSILSKRWQYLPTFIPILDFNELDNWHMNIKKTFGDILCFVTSINHTLIFCQSPKLVKFRVRMKFLEAFDDDVDVWVRFAMRKSVEELDLNFSESFYHYCYVDEEERRVDEEGSYVLPFNLLRNSSLLSLKLAKCEIQDFEVINWKSLKVLSLTEMSLSNDSIRDILLGTPSLESLELHNCRNYDFVEIKSERVQKLVIDDYNLPFVAGSDMLKIVAPNIQSLELLGDWSADKFSLVSSSSLVNAKLTFNLSRHFGSNPFEGPHREYPKIMRELIEELRNVKDLTLGNWCLQIISVLDKKALPSQLSNRVSLKIETRLSKWCLPGMTKLLACTPLLETLIINMTSTDFYLSEFELERVFMENSEFYDENYWPSHKSLFEQTLLNLKTVKIVDFMASAKEMYLIVFLLQNAKQLQTMIIKARKAHHWHLTPVEYMEVDQVLLSTPRCSPHAVVSFS